MMIDTTKARAFLDLPHLGVVGVSDDPKNFGRSVLQALHDSGRDAIAVRDMATEVRPLDGVIVMVDRSRSADVVRAALAHGVRHIWLFKGVGGAGSVSDDALAACAEAGADVIVGACPLMFLEPVTSVHRFHRGIRRLKGAVSRAA